MPGLAITENGASFVEIIGCDYLCGLSNTVVWIDFLLIYEAT